MNDVCPEPGDIVRDTALTPSKRYLLGAHQESNTLLLCNAESWGFTVVEEEPEVFLDDSELSW